jgi:hypothetical protein
MTIFWDKRTFKKCIAALAAFALVNLFLAPDEATMPDRFLLGHGDEPAATARTANIEIATVVPVEPLVSDVHQLEQLETDPRILFLESDRHLFDGAADTYSSCQRKCSHHRNKMYYVDPGAGLLDRTSIFHDMAALAGYLCAELVLPPPSRLLNLGHNNGEGVKKSVIWQDLYNITFLQDATPAIKNGHEEFGDNFGGWDVRGLFDSKSDGSKYKGWKHIISQNNMKRREELQTLLDFTYQQELDAISNPSSTSTEPIGFIWEWFCQFWHSDILRHDIPDPSPEIRKKAEEAGIWNSDMRPYVRVYDTNIDGCHYTPDYATSDHMKMMSKRIQDSIHSKFSDDTFYGLLQIRRGDAINDCDTTLETMKEYFACSFNGTEDIGRHITLLMMSDEVDPVYRQAVLDLIGDYPNVSIVDLDATVSKMVHEASVDGSIPEGMDNNNYYIFDIEQAYKGRVDFRMSKRRRDWCDDCVPVKEILLEKLGGRAHDEGSMIGIGATK